MRATKISVIAAVVAGAAFAAVGAGMAVNASTIDSSTPTSSVTSTPGADDPATHDVGDDNGVDDPATHDVGDDNGVDDPATHDVGDDNGVGRPGDARRGRRLDDERYESRSRLHELGFRARRLERSRRGRRR